MSQQPVIPLGQKSPMIDVHYHYFAPHILKPMGEFVIAGPDETDDAMAKLGTDAVIYSPVIWSKYNTEWDAAKWAGLCKTLTEEQAKEVQKYPAARGSFAPLPLPHVKETLEVIAYGEEHISPKPDGYAITTSANKKYLGDPIFHEILVECNRRKLVLFVHPNETIMPTLDINTYGFQMVEFPTETARCLMTMIDQGTFTKYPDIQWIFSHNGGSFPFLFQRVIRTLSGSKLIGVGGPDARTKQVNRITDNNAGLTLQEVFARGNINFECSQGTAHQQHMLKALGLSARNILTGSDWPFTGKAEVEATVAEMNAPETSGLFNAQELIDIKVGNALRIMPRLKEAWVQAGLIKA